MFYLQHTHKKQKKNEQNERSEYHNKIALLNAKWGRQKMNKTMYKISSKV